MKWLTATFLCVLASSTLAQDQQMIPFPSTMLCGEYNTGEGLELEYGELPFLEGTSSVLAHEPGKMYQGKIRLFLNPQDGSYSIIFDLEDQLSCFLTTGKNMQPIISGDGI